MESSPKATHIEKQRGGCAAAKECCRIFSTTFLSLLPPLSFLLFARFAASRHHTPNQNHELRPHTVLYTMSLFLHTTSTLVLSFLLFLVAVSTVGQRLTGVRRRLQNVVVWLSSMQVCLSLWVHGVAGDDDRIVSGGVGSLAFVRNMVLPLGLYEAAVLWRRNVVKPVVDDAVFGFSEEGFVWVENVLLGMLFYCLWWWRLRREAEEMVVLRGNVEAVDVVGWLFYSVMTAIGGVRVVRVLLWAVSRIFRRRRQAFNGEVHAVDSVYSRC